MDKQMIEFYRERGLMPDRIYYQLNGKSLQENYNEQHKRIIEQYAAAKREKEEQAALEKNISEQVESKLEKCLDKVLRDLLKDFK